MIAIVTKTKPSIGHRPHISITPIRVGLYTRFRVWWRAGRPIVRLWGRSWPVGVNAQLITWHFGIGPFIVRLGVPDEATARSWSATRYA